MQQLSIWEQESFYAPQDVIIIGSGFTGLWTALHLKQRHPSWKITILEAAPTPAGASARNAGFACFGSLTEVVSDIQTLGQETALQLVQWRYSGLQMIRQYFNSTAIDYLPCGGYEILQDETPLAALESINALLYEVTASTQTYTIENPLIEKFGLANAAYLVQNKFEGALHSGKLLQALSQAVASLGVQVLTQARVKRVEEINDISVYTNLEHVFTTKHLVYCTNGFSKQLLPEIDITPTRGQVLLTAPIPGLKLNGTFHYDEGYYYFRNLGNRVLLGGARNSSFATEYTLEQETTTPIQQQLETFLREVILPNQEYIITDRWAGIMGTGSQKTPVIKQLSERSYCAVRLSGMGVALAPVIGQQLAEMISIS